jgi:hypothetical protein
MSPEVHSPDEGGNQHALREGRPMRSTHLMREAISMHSGRSTHRARRRRPEQRRRSEAVVPDEGGNQWQSAVISKPSRGHHARPSLGHIL